MSHHLITGKPAALPTDLKKQPMDNSKERSGLELGFIRLWRSMYPGLPEPERNHQFCEGKKWALDFAWPAARLAVEIEGHYRHRSRRGFAKDHVKYRAAENAGWRVLKYPGDEWKERPLQILEEVAKRLEGMI